MTTVVVQCLTRVCATIESRVLVEREERRLVNRAAINEKVAKRRRPGAGGCSQQVERWRPRRKVTSCIRIPQRPRVPLGHAVRRPARRFNRGCSTSSETAGSGRTTSQESLQSPPQLE
eukprot:7067984-Prymnesium_polylepis.1